MAGSGIIMAEVENRIGDLKEEQLLGDLMN